MRRLTLFHCCTLDVTRTRVLHCSPLGQIKVFSVRNTRDVIYSNYRSLIKQYYMIRGNPFKAPVQQPGSLLGSSFFLPSALLTSHRHSFLFIRICASALPSCPIPFPVPRHVHQSSGRFHWAGPPIGPINYLPLSPPR